MTFLAKYRKADLIQLARELAVEVPTEVTIVELKKLITGAPSYEEDFVKELLNTWVKEKKEELERERERENLERERERENLERERENLEREERKEREQRQFELERLRIASARAEIIPEHDGNNRSRSARDLQGLIPKYNPNDSDISLYLVMFERQARKANIDEEDWVSHLMALLPLDIGQIILREPEEVSDDYSHIKKVLLERFRLGPEACRVKFVQHQRRTGSLWKDFAFELRNYLEEWLHGLGVEDFELLKDLMLTDQIKKKVSTEMREHFLDDWGKISSSTDLIGRLDEYEAVRSNRRKTGDQGPKVKEGVNMFVPRHIDPRPPPKTAIKTSPTAERSRSDQENWRMREFEGRRNPRCY